MYDIPGLSQKYIYEVSSMLYVCKRVLLFVLLDFQDDQWKMKVSIF